MASGGHRPAVLLPVLVCIALGLILAVASSIVAVLVPDAGQHAPRTSTRHDLPEDQSVYAFVVRRPGYLLMSVTGPMDSEVADALDDIRSQEIPISPGDPRPPWLRRTIRDEPSTPADAPQTSRGIAAGWPFLCLRGRTDRNVNFDPPSVDSGVAWVTVGGARRAFPWHPIWIGLIGNTAMYAGVMLVLWFACVGTLRGWRAHRGRCPACGYPLDAAQATCPECGRPRRKRDQPTGTGSSSASTETSASSLQTTSTLTSKSSSNEER